MNEMTEKTAKQIRSERVNRLIELADETERNVAEWIRSNPHVAMIYAMAAHENHWHGCTCQLHEMTKETE